MQQGVLGEPKCTKAAPLISFILLITISNTYDYPAALYQNGCCENVLNLN